MSFDLREDCVSIVCENLDAGRQLPHQVTSYCPCFTPGTLIKSDNGEIRVEEIVPGTRVLTRDNGYQPVIWTGLRNLSSAFLDNHPELRPIEIAAGALGENLPEQTINVSPQHRMLLNNDQIRRWFGEDEVLIAAHLLTCFEGVNATDVQDVTYVHFMFDQHEIVLANGAWSESYQPSEIRAGAMNEPHRTELLQLFPELEDGKISAFPAARTSIDAALLKQALVAAE